ncbi:MAG TPA: MFS transporter [Solirubrobacteraceae bacterium]
MRPGRRIDERRRRCRAHEHGTAGPIRVRKDAGHAAGELDQRLVATALPTIVVDLGGLSHLSWVVSAYRLAQTVVTPLYRKLGELSGRKLVLQAGLVVFLSWGAALGGVSPDPTELIAFRALQGLGGGGLMGAREPGSTTTAPESHADQQAGRRGDAAGAAFGCCIRSDG